MIRTCLTLCGLALALNPLAQTKSLLFANQDLTEVIAQLELLSGVTFNYAPAHAADVKVTGTYHQGDPEGSLRDLLRSTALDFRVEDNRILIFKDQPREYVLCGYIYTDELREPLSLASIHIDKGNQGTESDQNGFFSFRVTALKSEELQISYVGRMSRKIQIWDLSEDQCTDITLKTDPHLMGEEVLIRDFLLRGIDQGGGYGSTTLRLGTLSKSYPPATEDVFRTIQLLPGVTAIDGSATQLNIRGSTPDQNLVVWEGVTLYDPGHFFGMVSSINPFLIDKIDVHKTVFEPSFDNRIGAVIDLSLSSDLEDQVSGGFGLTMTEMHGDVRIPIIEDRLSVSLAGRHSLSSIFNSPTLTSYADKVFQDVRVSAEGDEAIQSDQPSLHELRYSDLTSKMIWQLAPGWKLTTAYTWNENHFEDEDEFLEEGLENSEMVASQGDALSIKLGRISETQNMQLRFGRSTYSMLQVSEYSESDEGQSFEMTSSNNTMVDQKLAFSNRWIQDNFQLELGYEWESKEAFYELKEQTSFLVEQFDDQEAKGTFHNFMASTGLELKNHTIRAGLRTSYYHELKGVFVSPRVSWQYKSNDFLKFRFSTGRFYQFVSQLQKC